MKKRSSKILIFLSLIFASLSANANTYGDDFCYDPSYPDCGFCNNWVVDVEFLYWKAREDDIGFAFTGFGGALPGNVEEVEWNWDPGFRVGVGYLFNCNDEISLTYTWFKSDADGSFFSPTGAGISNWNPIAVGFTTATASWHLHFQTLDLALKKHFCFCNRYFFSPYFALRGAYIKDNYDLFFSTQSVNGRHRQKFWGIGPQIGFNAAWNFWCSFSLVGEGAFTALWTHYDIRRVDTATVAASQSNIKHTFATIRFVPEYRVGLQWERGLCCDRYNLRILGAWEQQIWMDHNQMIYGNVSSGSPLFLNRNTNLNLYGLTLRTQFMF